MKNKGQTSEDDMDSGALSNPLSFLRSGFFGWGYAGLSNRGGVGDYWSLHSHSTLKSDELYVYDASLNPLSNDAHGFGFAVRCVDKSFTNLINTSYSMKVQGQTTEDNRDSGILSNPLSFLRSGYFYWSGAGLYGRGGGYYWSLRSSSTTYSGYLSFSNTNLYPQDNSARGYGFAVHCVCKSFTTLINTSYSMKIYGQTSEDSQDSGVLSNPLSFLRSGYFYWLSTGLYDRGSYGGYWFLRSATTTVSNGLGFFNTYLNPQNSGDRGYGFAVRCVATSQILHHSH